ncbi:hypothetical protein ACFLVP_02185 [Chloroflexota bacterium]
MKKPFPIIKIVLLIASVGCFVAASIITTFGQNTTMIVEEYGPILFILLGVFLLIILGFIVLSDTRKARSKGITTEAVSHKEIIIPKYIAWAIILSIVIAIVAVVLYFRYVPITP